MWNANSCKIHLGAVTLLAVTSLSWQLQRDICHLARRNNYPCEVHSVYTPDGYILSTVRIPYSPSPAAKQTNVSSKPVVFLMHGLTCSSDCWLVHGAHDGLAFMLADAGYDVWLGNARGNVYSRRHVSISPLSNEFWDFEFHEIGVYDLPATTDYILSSTQQKSLHYIAHSQGTTVFLVWLASIPGDSIKIKTSHLLGPAAYNDHMSLPFGVFMGHLFKNFELWSRFIAPMEFAGRSEIMESVVPQTCYNGLEFQKVCIIIMTFLGIWSPNMNAAWLADFLAIYPSGCSNRQILHFLQEFNSGHFRRFDYGKKKNIQMYNSAAPPDYKVELINPIKPVDMYYSDSDYISTSVDAMKLARRMGTDHVNLHRVTARGYSHVDFILAENVKKVINNCILNKMDTYENRASYDSSSCAHLATTIIS